VRTLTPVQVLDVHADVAARMQNPSPALARYIGLNLRKTIENQWACGQSTQGQFHPVVKVGSKVLPGANEGGEMARLPGRGLREAVTYQVTAGMVADIRRTFENTMAEIDQLHEKELPSPAGFAWLDEPWVIPDGQGELFRVRAMSWEFTEAWTVEDVVAREELAKFPDAARQVMWPCVRVGLWMHDADDGDLATAPALGPLVLTHTGLLPLGLPFIPAESDAEHASSHAMLGLVHLLWIYLGMEITSQARTRPVMPPFARKRLRKSIRHAEVRVVTLRKIRGVTEPEPGQSREVFWSCRWPVQGHYRHREHPADGHHAIAGGTDKHCAVCGQELSWVRPFIKGPAGLPLHAPDRTLMKLAR
jgi:hypothetical protein